MLLSSLTVYADGTMTEHDVGVGETTEIQSDGRDGTNTSGGKKTTTNGRSGSSSGSSRNVYNPAHYQACRNAQAAIRGTLEGAINRIDADNKDAFLIGTSSIQIGYDALSNDELKTIARNLKTYYENLGLDYCNKFGLRTKYQSVIDFLGEENHFEELELERAQMPEGFADDWDDTVREINGAGNMAGYNFDRQSGAAGYVPDIGFNINSATYNGLYRAEELNGMEFNSLINVANNAWGLKPMYDDSWIRTTFGSVASITNDGSYNMDGFSELYQQWLEHAKEQSQNGDFSAPISINNKYTSFSGDMNPGLRTDLVQGGLVDYDNWSSRFGSLFNTINDQHKVVLIREYRVTSVSEASLEQISFVSDLRRWKIVNQKTGALVEERYTNNASHSFLFTSYSEGDYSVTCEQEASYLKSRTASYALYEYLVDASSSNILYYRQKLTNTPIVLERYQETGFVDTGDAFVFHVNDKGDVTTGGEFPTERIE